MLVPLNPPHDIRFISSVQARFRTAFLFILIMALLVYADISHSLRTLLLLCLQDAVIRVMCFGFGFLDATGKT